MNVRHAGSISDEAMRRGWLIASRWLAAHLDPIGLASADATVADQCLRSQQSVGLKSILTLLNNFPIWGIIACFPNWEVAWLGHENYRPVYSC